jgi:predicted metalloprotease
MKWTPGSVSEDIEDRRGGGGGGGFRGPVGIGVVLVLLVLSLLTGKNFLSLLDSGATSGQSSSDQAAPPGQTSPEEDRLVQFVSFVLDDAQKTWQQTLPGYRKAKLVLFRDTTDTACGLGQTASGPFYCPGDEKVYLDLGFFDELRSRFGASGDFAEAYVITHELGHHVQRLRGIEGQVRQLQESRPSQAKALSVRLELQADCYAGVWGHSTAQRNILEQGDVESAMNAAASIGDDRIQQMSGRAVHPESFTHGSSAERVAWFKRGFQNGDLNACDTFGGT